MLELLLRLLDQHPGTAALLGVATVALIYAQANLMLDVRWIRRHLHGAPTKTQFETFKDSVHSTLTVQAEDIARDYVKIAHCQAIHKELKDGSNGGAADKWRPL